MCSWNVTYDAIHARANLRDIVRLAETYETLELLRYEGPARHGRLAAARRLHLLHGTQHLFKMAERDGLPVFVILDHWWFWLSMKYDRIFFQKIIEFWR